MVLNPPPEATLAPVIPAEKWHHDLLLKRLLRACSRFQLASYFANPSYILRTALSNRLASMLPDTRGTGAGFIHHIIGQGTAMALVLFLAQR